MKLQFNNTYFISFFILLIIEVGIATLLSSGFIRSTFGDYLVVILIYCCIRSFAKASPLLTALYVLAFAYLIEFLQLLNLLEWLSLKNNHILNLVLGNTFQFSDLIAYALGTATILFVEYKILHSIFKAVYSKPPT